MTASRQRTKKVAELAAERDAAEEERDAAEDRAADFGRGQAVCALCFPPNPDPPSMPLF